MADGDAGQRFVLSERAAVEVLAYLVTAARTQVDEAPEYGPLRLMTAASRLADGLREHATPTVRALTDAIDALPGTAVPRHDRDGYVARLDAACLAVADCLLALAGDR